MKDQILKLQAIAKTLEPSIPKMDEWNQAVMEYGKSFISTIYNRPAYDGDSKRSRKLDELKLKDSPGDIANLLELLGEAVDSVGINPASGGHLGYIPGGGVFASSLGDYLADITNRYSGIYYANPGAVRMENLLIRWMNDLIGYPETAAGNLASGGSIANLIAITSARDAKGISSDKIRKSVVYLTAQTHHCVHKALRIAGLGECILREVPMDPQYRMNPVELNRLIQEDKQSGHIAFLIVGSIGSTDTGSVDPIDQIADIAEHEDCWFHIDAAYGGFFILVEELKHLFNGVERADSIVMDPHKTLFLPYGLGTVLVKDGKTLFNSHYYRANYMQDAYSEDNQLSPADLSPELTKHFRGLRMWLPLHLHGLDPFKAAIKEKWMLCRYFYDHIQSFGFEVGPQPELSVCLYRYIPEDANPNDFNAKLVEAVKADGTIFISSTTIDGIYWIRLAVVCFRTHLHIIEEYLTILKNKLKELQS